MDRAVKVAMIGDGRVGSALTAGLQRAGYEVQTVGKDPVRVREVAAWGDVIVLAVPFEEREATLREMEGTFAGKPLVDVTNSVRAGQFVGSAERSGAEGLQEMARGAKVVKAFNTAFAQTMTTGHVHGERLTTFVAGDDPAAKQHVARMAQDIGFDAVDAGPLKNARWLEALGFLNIQLAFEQGLGPALGTRLVRPPGGPGKGR